MIFFFLQPNFSQQDTPVVIAIHVAKPVAQVVGKQFQSVAVEVMELFRKREPGSLPQTSGLTRLRILRRY
jgi:hypothetical protein